MKNWFVYIDDNENVGKQSQKYLMKILTTKSKYLEVGFGLLRMITLPKLKGPFTDFFA